MSVAAGETDRRLVLLLVALLAAAGMAAASAGFFAARREWLLSLAIATSAAGLLAILGRAISREQTLQTDAILVRGKRLEAELAGSRERLRASLTGAAHELSQPLTTLHGTLELGLLSPSLPAVARPFLEEALQQASSAMVLTRLLSELADAESDGSSATAISLAEILKEMREDLEALALIRGVRLDLHCESPAMVVANPLDLRRSLLYLAEHAFDRSPAESVVKISVEEQTSSANLVIADQGPLIPAKDLSHWFEPFYCSQAGSGRKRDSLRLAIVERTCASWRGSVRATSTGSRGAKFILQLPLA